MAYNKVMDKIGNVLLDLTNDTVTEEDVKIGKSFHDRYGNIKFGKFDVNSGNNGSGDVDQYGDPDNFTGVIFFDALGRVVANYTIEEARNLTELPPLPVIEEEDLIGVCWNHTLDDIKFIKNPTVIGACYKTSDETTQIVVDYTYNHSKEIKLNVYASTSYPTTVDWGDGIIEEQTSYPLTHTYLNSGIYTIKLRNYYVHNSSSTSIPNVFFGCQQYKREYLLLSEEENKRILKLKISKDFTFFGEYALYQLINCEIITFEGWQMFKDKYNFPHELATNPFAFKDSGVYSGSNIKSLTIPRGSIEPSVTYNLIKIRKDYEKRTFDEFKRTKIDLGGFCYNSFSSSASETYYIKADYNNLIFYNIISEVYIFNHATEGKKECNVWIGEKSKFYFDKPDQIKCIRLNNVNGLQNNGVKGFLFQVPPSDVNEWKYNYIRNTIIRVFEMPNTVTSIKTNVSSKNLKVLKLTSHESVPTLSSSSYIQSDCLVVVDDSLLDTFKSTTNWSTRNIISKTEYENLIKQYGNYILKGEI